MFGRNCVLAGGGSITSVQQGWDYDCAVAACCFFQFMLKHIRFDRNLAFKLSVLKYTNINN
jgi:hypothetical protein